MAGTGGEIRWTRLHGDRYVAGDYTVAMHGSRWAIYRNGRRVGRTARTSDIGRERAARRMRRTRSR
jgi:hypothetical protein